MLDTKEMLGFPPQDKNAFRTLPMSSDSWLSNLDSYSSSVMVCIQIFPQYLMYVDMIGSHTHQWVGKYVDRRLGLVRRGSRWRNDLERCISLPRSFFICFLTTMTWAAFLHQTILSCTFSLGSSWLWIVSFRNHEPMNLSFFKLYMLSILS